MDKRGKAHEYSNGDVTIVWRPELCIHSTFCFTSLPEVFRPGRRPWIDPRGAETARIVSQIEVCPSGALTYYRNKKDE